MRCDQPILYKIQAREIRNDLDFTDKLKMYKRIMSLDNLLKKPSCNTIKLKLVFYISTLRA